MGTWPNVIALQVRLSPLLWQPRSASEPRSTESHKNRITAVSMKGTPEGISYDVRSDLNLPGLKVPRGWTDPQALIFDFFSLRHTGNYNYWLFLEFYHSVYVLLTSLTIKIDYFPKQH
jgi:hypothetical protein